MKLLLPLILAISFLFLSCGADPAAKTTDDSTDDTGVTISGSLAIGSSKSASAYAGVTARGLSRAVEDYKIYCVTFETIPSAASGDASNTGAFSLTLAGAKDKAFGCFIQAKLTSAIIGTLVIEDDSSKDMSGENVKTGEISLKGSASLGVITLDLDKGQATVTKSAIQLTGTSTSAVSTIASM